MPCTRPLRAYKVPGGVSFSETPDSRELWLPCGKCADCRFESSRQWALRCMHEAKCWPVNCALTLTYSDSHLPPGGSLRYRDWQLFFKRLRRFIAPLRVRFFMCGEYGELKLRPHFHALLFNFDFLDKKLWKKTSAGSLIYRSSKLEELWPFGHSSVGEVTFQSAAYVARYAMKKLNGDIVHVREDGRIDLRTGEILPLVPEFIHMSLKPGIGYGWLMRHVDDVYNFDRVVIDGKEVKPPRYYDRVIQKRHPFAWKEISQDREQRALDNAEDNTARRLDAKSIVTLARLSKLKRSFE